MYMHVNQFLNDLWTVYDCLLLHVTVPREKYQMLLITQELILLSPKNWYFYMHVCVIYVFFQH